MGVGRFRRSETGRHGDTGVLHSVLIGPKGGVRDGCPGSEKPVSIWLV